MRLGDVLAKWRWAHKISLRDAAKMIGISVSCLSRIERDNQMDGAALGKILTWLLQEIQK